MSPQPNTNSLAECSLQDLEAVIERGLKTFLEVGTALLVIRDRRLYREQGFSTFEDYCQKRWAWGRNYVNKQIAAAEVVLNLGTTVPIPQNERQARELVRLPPEAQRAVASQIDFRTATAADIRAKIDTISHPPERKDAAKAVQQSKAPAEDPPKRKPSDLTSAVSDTVAMVKKVPVAQRAEFIESVMRELQLVYCKTAQADPEAKLPAAAEDWLIHDVLQFLRNLRQTIVDKRKEARAEQVRRQWNPDAMIKLELIKLIDWIEAELDNLPVPRPPERVLPVLPGREEETAAQPCAANAPDETVAPNGGATDRVAAAITTTRQALNAWSSATEKRIVATLELAATLCEARQMHASDQEFGVWLAENGLGELGKDDRDALIGMGRHPVLARAALEETDCWSPEHIWVNLIQPKLSLQDCDLAR